MKIQCALTALLVLQVPALAAVKIPKGVFSPGQYEEALKQAKAQKKPLAIVQIDDAAEAKPAVEAAEEAFKAVMATSVTMYITTARSSDDLYNLAPPVITAVTDMGDHYAPTIILCAPTEDVVWKVIASLQNKATPKDLKQLYRNGVAEAKPAITAYFAAKTPPVFTPPGDKVLFWPLAKEKGYKGAFGKVEDDKLFIKNEKGELGQPIELKDLRPTTARWAKMVAAGGAAPVPAAPASDAPAGPEKWTSSKGQEIEATFVKLENGKVTLRLTTGKDSIVPLTALSAASQARAKELAAKPAKP